MSVALADRAAPQVRRHARFQGGLALLVLAGCLGTIALRGHIVFPLDDAYITLHNARVVLTGRDPSFPGVPALVGATSPVHLALVAALMLVVPPAVASFLAGTAACVAYALGLARMAFDRADDARFAALIVALGLLSGYAPFQLLNGLETGLAMAAVAWALVLAGRPPADRLLPLVCGVMPFIRPELAALAGPLLLRRLWQRRAAGAVDLALACAAAAPWLAWSWWDAGTLLPSTLGAKAAFFADAPGPLPWRAAIVLLGCAEAGLGALLVGLFLLPRSSLSLCVAGFVGLFVAAFALTSVVVTGHNSFRYDHVLLPALAYAATWARRPGLRRAGSALLAAGLAFALVLLPRHWQQYVDALAVTDTARAGSARWARDHLPPDAVILVHDIGYIAYATEFRLIDLVGLKTPESIAYHRRWTLASGGRRRGEAIAAIARAFAPGYAIILNDGPDTQIWAGTAAALRQQGWRLDPLHDPPGEDYGIYRLTPPGLTGP